VIALGLSPLQIAKAIGGLVVFALLGVLVYVVLGWKEKADDWPLLKAELDEAYLYLEQYEKDIRQVQEASRGYQEELAMVRSAAARERVPVVRLCRSAAAAPKLPAPVAGPDATAPAPGGVPPEARLPSEPGQDIGPELYADADRADELSAQVRGLQEYALACSGQTPAPERSAGPLH
jgi:hypothetical protein